MFIVTCPVCKEQVEGTLSRHLWDVHQTTIGVLGHKPINPSKVIGDGTSLDHLFIRYEATKDATK